MPYTGIKRSGYELVGLPENGYRSAIHGQTPVAVRWFQACLAIFSRFLPRRQNDRRQFCQDRVSALHLIFLETPTVGIFQ
jgi:hypothetical protein